MSLRDQFAREAMNGVLSNPHTRGDGVDYEGFAKKIAEISYVIADAMLAERENAKRAKWEKDE